VEDQKVARLDAEVESLARTTTRPSLHALAYALRHPETWPPDFVWDYSDCECCAVGLALRLWPALALPDDQKARETWIAREMAMPHRDAVRIFFRLGPTKIVTKKDGWFRTKQVRHLDFDAVHADDVADAIDRFLAVS
jgi:hypothetical protein